MNPISTIVLDPLRPGTPASGGAQRAWQVGQLLAATVESVAPSGQVRLRIHNQSLTAQSQLNLRPGQQLQLEVLRAGAQPVLKLQAPAAADDIGTQALRQALPRQLPITPLLSQLSTLAAGVPNAKADAPSTAWQSLWQSLSSSQSLSQASGLKQAILNSGLFLEARLASGQTQNIGQDFKAQLLRLVARLGDGTTSVRGAPPAEAAARQAAAADAAEFVDKALLAQAQGSLARVQSAQLHQLAEPNTQGMQWSLEIPARHERGAHLVRLDIERDAQAPEQGAAPRFSVQLSLDLPGLGPVHARLGLSGQSVDLSLWAEHADTVELFGRQLNELRTALQTAGLDVARLSCQQGGAPPRRSSTLPPLLDTRA